MVSLFFHKKNRNFNLSENPDLSRGLGIGTIQNDVNDVYLNLSNLSKQDWKKRLLSNQGLFHKVIRDIKTGSINYVGPRIMGSYENMDFGGDMFLTELMVFEEHATKEQKMFFELLLKNRPIRAREYVLTVINAIDTWKKDVKQLNDLYIFLEQENEQIKKEGEIVKSLLRFRDFDRARMKKHMNNILRDLGIINKIQEIDFDILNLIKKIKETEKVLEFKNRLGDYLKQLKKNMPFLFD